MRVRPSLLQLAFLVCAACLDTAPADSTTLKTAVERSAIAYGTSDSAHTAVVALLAAGTGNMFAECSGTIVQVKNGQAYVLTAAHCCNNTVPTVVVMSNDYTVGENYLGGATPHPPAFAVTSGSAYYDSNYNMQAYDFCMLKFAAPAGTPVISVAGTADNVVAADPLEHVGFGVTDTTTNNSGRRSGTAPVKTLSSTTLSSDQGGSSNVPGVCEGDSGGPALLPAGAAQTAQVVVGVTSYGDASSCATNTFNVAMRVSSETGPNGFITKFLADEPIGQQAGSAPSSCNTCETAAASGACKPKVMACQSDPKCLALNSCVAACTTQGCANACATTAGQTAVGEYNAIDMCICDTACTTLCASLCSQTGAGGGSAGTGGGTAHTGGGAQSGTGGGAQSGTGGGTQSGTGGDSAAGGGSGGDPIQLPLAQTSGPPAQLGCASVPGDSAVLLALGALLLRRRSA